MNAQGIQSFDYFSYVVLRLCLGTFYFVEAFWSGVRRVEDEGRGETYQQDEQKTGVGYQLKSPFDFTGFLY
jgi:hypothetical protein